MSLLKATKSSLGDIDKKADNLIAPVDDLVKDKWKDMLKKINDGTAGNKELFQLVDSEGGKIVFLSLD
jgi:hypothetical protein